MLRQELLLTMEFRQRHQADMKTEAAAGKIRGKGMFRRKGGGRREEFSEKYVSPGKEVTETCWERERQRQTGQGGFVAIFLWESWKTLLE